MDNKTRYVPAAVFKANCLRMMDEVARQRRPIIITKRGKPVAKLVPADDAEQEFIGRLKGVIRSVGDIESPIEPPEAWEVLR